MRWLEAYLVSGVRVVWMIDPAKRPSGVIGPDLTVRTAGEGEPLDGGSALPGLSCNVSDLFGLHGQRAA